MGPIIDQVRHALIARSQRGPCPLLAWKLLDHTQPAVGEPQVAVVQAWSSLAAFEDFWQDLLSHGALAESTQAGNASFRQVRSCAAHPAFAAPRLTGPVRRLT